MSEKLRITFVAHRLDRLGGQEKSSHEVLSRIRGNGHRVDVISFSIDEWSIEDGISSWHRVPGNWIKVQLIKNLWFSFYTMLYLLIKRPSLVMTIGVSSWIANIRVVQFVHTRYLSNVRKGLAVLPNERSIIHRYYQLAYSKWSSVLEHFLFKRTLYFIAISNVIKEEILEVLGNHNKSSIVVVHHAPDKTGFTNKTVPSLGTLELLFVGALERKGVRKVFDILKRIEDQDWYMNIVGDGDLKKWKKLASDLSLDHKIKIHGARPSVPFFEKAHIFVFPSTYEPFGLVVSEAISFRALPMASSECGAMELWDSRPENLKLSACDDAQKWATSLETYILDREKLQGEIDNASSAILKRNWDDAALEYERFLLSFSH